MGWLGKNVGCVSVKINRKLNKLAFKSELNIFLPSLLQFEENYNPGGICVTNHLTTRQIFDKDNLIELMSENLICIKVIYKNASEDVLHWTGRLI